ncbi:MAG: DUF3090 domain-containing protein [Acidimicrobiales bacterium]
MSTSFDLPSPDVFTAGAVGPAGQRVFYIQVRDDALTLSVRCEKQQVAALAEYFDGLLEDLEPAPYGVAVADLELAEPLNTIWTVGAIGVAYDEASDRIVVVLEEIIDVEAGDDATDGDEESESDPSGASVKVRLSRAQLSAFVRHTKAVVAAGRPPCRFCGLPIDPDGHPCPKMN